jgi:dipeptidyl-peptidase-4
LRWQPSSFDAFRKYPVIVYVYGEPWGWRSPTHGVAMVFFCARSLRLATSSSASTTGVTPAPKGAAWRQVVYGSVGDLSSKEQAAAVRALASRHTFIDASRIGIWGWSGGGTTTLNAMFRFPDIYKVGHQLCRGAASAAKARVAATALRMSVSP